MLDNSVIQKFIFSEGNQDIEVTRISSSVSLIQGSNYQLRGHSFPRLYLFQRNRKYYELAISPCSLSVICTCGGYVERFSLLNSVVSGSHTRDNHPSTLEGHIRSAMHPLCRTI